MSKLPQPRFNLKSPKSKDRSLIILIFRYRGNRLVYSFREHINPSDWYKTNNRPILRENREDLRQLRIRIDQIAKICLDIYVDFDQGAINISTFKKAFDDRLASSEITNQKSFRSPAPQIESRIEFLDFATKHLITMRRQGLKPGSYKAFKGHLDQWKDFAKSAPINKHGFTYEDVN